jgi:hypothetical protein
MREFSPCLKLADHLLCKPLHANIFKTDSYLMGDRESAYAGTYQTGSVAPVWGRSDTCGMSAHTTHPTAWKPSNRSCFKGCETQ